MPVGSEPLLLLIYSATAASNLEASSLRLVFLEAIAKVLLLFVGALSDVAGRSVALEEALSDEWDTLVCFWLLLACLVWTLWVF